MGHTKLTPLIRYIAYLNQDWSVVPYTYSLNSPEGRVALRQLSRRVKYINQYLRENYPVFNKTREEINLELREEAKTRTRYLGGKRLDHFDLRHEIIRNKLERVRNRLFTAEGPILRKDRSQPSTCNCHPSCCTYTNKYYPNA